MLFRITAGDDAMMRYLLLDNVNSGTSEIENSLTRIISRNFDSGKSEEMPVCSVFQLKLNI